MLNVVILIGRLTQNPELRKAGDVSVCHFTLAVERPKRNGEEKKVDFIDIEVWREQAENVYKYCRKGDPVAVVGSLHIETWEDKDGNRRRSLKVVVSRVRFLPTGRKAEGEAEPGKEPEELKDEDIVMAGDLDLDDIPF
ncbi:single-stranded DNA-binding protein [Ammonifex thiophilus]|uniref:Single-stranded DNA-binding protein n=1 Tax=Ammonifex thiophilus TaxID=444093 RepID=A0A3D8P5X3_9THEO|nr:single-stranded DNA-binding protein [Ammonifex thiophilus]RDV83917.1 single-stranded DNA-binding protein [Ammonifex thiophilus]